MARRTALALAFPTAFLALVGTLERRVFADSVEGKVKDARAAAARGDVGGMDFYLGQAAEQAGKTGGSLDPADVQAIRKTGWSQGIQMRLKDARAAAARGEVSGMEFWLRTAAEHAEKLGTSLDEGNLQETRRLGWKEGMQAGLRDARAAAARGERSGMELWLRTAAEHATKLGVSIDQAEVDAIRQTPAGQAEHLDHRWGSGSRSSLRTSSPAHTSSGRSRMMPRRSHPGRSPRSRN